MIKCNRLTDKKDNPKKDYKTLSKPYGIQKSRFLKLMIKFKAKISKKNRSP